MKNQKEKRFVERHRTFWTVVQIDPTSNQEIGLGFLLNISELGMNIWVDPKLGLKEDDFNVKLYPPDNLKLDPIELSVCQVWRKVHENKSLIEIGCEFKHLTPKLIEDIKRHLITNKHLILKGAIMLDS